MEQHTPSLNILVVDDEPTNREIAGVLLSHCGHHVTTCENGAEALALCIDEGRRFDVILMDVLMPVMDGLTAIRALRAHEATKDLPIICVSARASGSDSAAGLAAGADRYIRKPYKRSELLIVLTQLLSEKGLGEDSPPQA